MDEDIKGSCPRMREASSDGELGELVSCRGAGSSLTEDTSDPTEE